MNKPILKIDVLSSTFAVINSELTAGKKQTFSSADASASATTLTVKSITGFAIKQILLIGEWGQENAEIIKTHTTTSPTGTTITLASALTYAHNQGTQVTLLDFNQVEFSRSATASGTKAVLTTIALQADQTETIYRDTANTTGYGFVRFKDDINTLYSGYSDATPYTGWSGNEVGHLIEYALKRNKITFTDNITHEFCVDEINSCLQKIHGEKKKWSRLQEFDYDLGDTAQGENVFTLPTNMYGYSPKSVVAVHIASEPDLEYKDEQAWNGLLEETNQTTLDGAVTAGDTTLTVDGGLDIDGTTVMIEGQDIIFSNIDTTTGVITGIPASGTGSVTANLSDGSKVWNGEFSEGKPLYYTIKEGNLHFYPLVDDNWDVKNVWLDYWKETPTVDSDADTLDFPRFDMIKHALSASIRWQLKNDGIPDLRDGDYLLFREQLEKMIMMDLNTTNQQRKLKPRVNKIL